MSRPTCQICNAPMEFSHRIPTTSGEIIKRYRCQIDGAEITVFPRQKWAENKEIRRAVKEASGDFPRQNARLTR